VTTSVRPGSSGPPIRWGACLALLLTVSAVAPAQTGTIVGTVRDSAGAAVAGAEVTVAGTRLRAVADSAGAFRLTLVPTGEQRVRARRLGFRLRELPATIIGERPTEVRFVLARLAQELSTVVVQAKVDQRARHLAGFYERRKMGLGRYITQDRIDARNTNSLQDLLTGELPGIRVVRRLVVPMRQRRPLRRAGGRWSVAAGAVTSIRLLSPAMLRRRCPQPRERHLRLLVPDAIAPTPAEGEQRGNPGSGSSRCNQPNDPSRHAFGDLRHEFTVSTPRPRNGGSGQPRPRVDANFGPCRRHTMPE